MKINFLDQIQSFKFPSTPLSKSKILPICALISLVAAMCFIGYQVFQRQINNLKEKQIKKQAKRHETSPKTNSETRSQEKPEKSETKSVTSPTTSSSRQQSGPINNSDNPRPIVKKDDPKKVPIVAKLPDISSLSNISPFPNQPDLAQNIENQIFSFLKLEDLKKCPLISKSWFASFQKDTVWKNFAKQFKIPLVPTSSIKKQVLECYYDFGIYDQNSHQIIATRELGTEDCQKIMKNIPQTYICYYWGMGKFDIFYHIDGKYGELDSDSTLYHEESGKLFEKIQKECVHIYLSESKFKPKLNRLNVVKC